MLEGIKIMPNGSATHIEFDGLKDMQDVVGGLIECVSDPSENFDIYVNEEGLLKGLPINALASIISGRRLVGPALVTGKPDEDGDLTHAPDGIMTRLHQTAMIMEITGVPAGDPSWEKVG